MGDGLWLMAHGSRLMGERNRGFTMKVMKGLKVKKMKVFCLSESGAVNRGCGIRMADIGGSEYGF